MRPIGRALVGGRSAGLPAPVTSVGLAAFPASGVIFPSGRGRSRLPGRIFPVTPAVPRRHDSPVTLRVLLADDHAVVRAGLRALLTTLDGVDVVGEAADGEAAVREAQLLHPDVVLMDLRMPGLDGVEATRRIVAQVPGTAVLVLTLYEDDATVHTAMAAGARGYLLKDVEQEELIAAIRAVAAGQVIFAPGVAGRVLAQFALGPPAGASVAFPELTARERDILELLASGLRTAAIAERLFLSPKTISNHLTSIFAKLRVTDRAAAIVRARQGGLGS